MPSPRYLYLVPNKPMMVAILRGQPTHHLVRSTIIHIVPVCIFGYRRMKIWEVYGVTEQEKLGTRILLSLIEKLEKCRHVQ